VVRYIIKVFVDLYSASSSSSVQTSNELCGHDSATLQTDGQTDTRTDRRHVIAIPRFAL